MQALLSRDAQELIIAHRREQAKQNIPLSAVDRKPAGALGWLYCYHEPQDLRFGEGGAFIIPTHTQTWMEGLCAN